MLPDCRGGESGGKAVRFRGCAESSGAQRFTRTAFDGGSREQDRVFCAAKVPENPDHDPCGRPRCESSRYIFQTLAHMRAHGPWGIRGRRRTGIWPAWGLPPPQAQPAECTCLPRPMWSAAREPWKRRNPTVRLAAPSRAAPMAKVGPDPVPVAMRTTTQPIVASGITTRHHRPRMKPTRSSVGITYRVYV